MSLSEAAAQWSCGSIRGGPSARKRPGIGAAESPHPVGLGSAMPNSMLVGPLAAPAIWRPAGGPCGTAQARRSLPIGTAAIWGPTAQPAMRAPRRSAVSRCRFSAEAARRSRARTGRQATSEPRRHDRGEDGPVLDIGQTSLVDAVVGGDVVIAVAAQDAGPDDGDLDGGETYHKALGGWVGEWDQSRSRLAGIQARKKRSDFTLSVGRPQRSVVSWGCIYGLGEGLSDTSDKRAEIAATLVAWRSAKKRKGTLPEFIRAAGPLRSFATIATSRSRIVSGPGTPTRLSARRNARVSDVIDMSASSSWRHQVSGTEPRCHFVARSLQIHA